MANWTLRFSTVATTSGGAYRYFLGPATGLLGVERIMRSVVIRSGLILAKTPTENRNKKREWLRSRNGRGLVALVLCEVVDFRVVGFAQSRRGAKAQSQRPAG